MRKPASDVAGIEEVNTKQDKISYTPADDSKVAHNTGTEEITGQKTFNIAPIDKTTGNPYITKDGVPAVPSTLADTTKDANFTGKLQKSGIDVATTTDVTTAISTATTNFVANKHPNTPWVTIIDTPSNYLAYRFYNQSLFIIGKLCIDSGTSSKLESIPSSIVSKIDFPHSAKMNKHYGFTIGYLHSNMMLNVQATLNSVASIAILLQPTGDIIIDPLMQGNISGLDGISTYSQDIYAVLPLIQKG